MLRDLRVAKKMLKTHLFVTYAKKYLTRNGAVAAHQPHKLEADGSNPSSAIISVADETVIGKP